MLRPNLTIRCLSTGKAVYRDGHSAADRLFLYVLQHKMRNESEMKPVIAVRRKRLTVETATNNGGTCRASACFVRPPVLTSPPVNRINKAHSAGCLSGPKDNLPCHKPKTSPYFGLLRTLLTSLTRTGLFGVSFLTALQVHTGYGCQCSISSLCRHGQNLTSDEIVFC